jgi:hypothetical protein
MICAGKPKPQSGNGSNVSGSTDAMAVRFFSERQRRGRARGKSAAFIPGLRASQLDRLFLHRYGETLPDDETGRAHVWLVSTQLAFISNASDRIAGFIARRAPWMTEDEVSDTIASAVPRKWRADKLGERLQVTIDERRDLALTTIGAVGQTKRQREDARREAHRLREARRRQSRRAQRNSTYNGAHA